MVRPELRYQRARQRLAKGLDELILRLDREIEAAGLFSEATRAENRSEPSGIPMTIADNMDRQIGCIGFQRLSQFTRLATARLLAVGQENDD